MPGRGHGNVQKHESSNPVQRLLIDRFHARAVEYVRQADPSRVLEVGCGEGYVLAALLDAGIDAELVGVDRSGPAIEAARARLGEAVTLHVGDASELASTRTDRTPDLVLMLEVLEHLDDPEAMLDDLASLTSRHVLLSVPREPMFRGMNLLRLKHVRDLGNDPEHVNHWSSGAFVDFVARRFDVVAHSRPFPWTMVLARRRD